MKYYLYPLLGMLSFTQCSTKSEKNTTFINQLTQKTWYLTDPADINIASAIPLIFNTDGSFTYNFTDIDGVITPLVHKINTVGHSTFAYYTFEYTLNKEVLKLFIGVGIGFNNIAQKPIIYQGSFKKTPPFILPSATIEEKKTWYTDTYKESNIFTHTGTTLAIQ